MRWLLLDHIVTVEKGNKAVTRARVFDERFSSEVLMLEAMAQTGGLLLGAESNFQQNLIFAKIENAHFQAPDRKGPLLEIEAKSDNLRSEGAWMDASVKQGGRRIASARLLLMNAGVLIPDREKSITFHDAFMNHFSVREKVVC